MPQKSLFWLDLGEIHIFQAKQIEQFCSCLTFIIYFGHTNSFLFC